MEGIFKTEVDLSGLMKVLGDNLYSTPNVALRELIQNGHDSCTRRRLEDQAPPAPRLSVRPDLSAGTLAIEDNGAGLTRDEIQRYLACVGSGYTRTLRDAGRGDDLIGYFGLGFLSAYVVSERTQVHTASYQAPDDPWLFESRNGETYTLRQGAPRPVGTTVTLHLKPAFRQLADPEVVLALLRRYACLLPLPITCQGTTVNDEPPPWRLRDDDPLARQRTFAFAQRFEPHWEPLFTLPIPPANAPADPHGLQGVLWVQGGASYGTLDNRRVWVFVRGMLVSDDERDLLPRWAGFCGAVIACDALTPTASRESIQKDATYKHVQAAIHRALNDGFAAVAARQRAAWERFTLRHNEALRGAAVADPDLFRLLADDITLPTSEGELTAAAALRRAQGRLYVTQGEQRGPEELLFRALKTPVIDGSRYGALPFARRFTEARGGDLAILGTQRGDASFFPPASLDRDRDQRLRDWFAAEDVEVVLSRFKPDTLPLILVPDRDAELKRRIDSDEANKRIATAALSLARLYTAAAAAGPTARLYLNLDSPLIPLLLDAPEHRRATALHLLRALVAMHADPAREDVYMSVDEALTAWGDAVRQLLDQP